MSTAAARPFRLALPKGRFLTRSIELVKKLGGPLVDEGKLICNVRSHDFVVHFMKARDIPMLVASRLVDAGITPEEWYLEHMCTTPCQESPILMTRVDWIRTNLVFYSESGFKWPEGSDFSVATPFPNLAIQSVARWTATRPRVLHLSGSTEAAVPSLAVVGYDCSESGKTIADHGLETIDVTHEGLQCALLAYQRTPHRSMNSILEAVEDSLL
jgi:ATP phosphoribosyltransferase